jgi:gamma-glutamyltranspeptidase/glutathione hydrolase
VLSTVDQGLDPQAALDAPRWYWHAGRQVAVEAGLAAGPDGAALVEGLRRRGHEVSVDDGSGFFGYGQAVWRLADGGYVVGSEPRADGAAYGY